MKYCLILAIAALLTLSVTKANADKIPLKKLPKTAQKFLVNNLGKDVVSEVTQNGFKDSASYKVLLKDGTNIEFDSNGVIKNVIAAENSTVPYSLIPQRIQELLQKHYPGQKLVHFKFVKGEYETKFITGGSIIFDHECNFRVINIRK